MPKYSVIVPVYNRPDELRELIISLINQDYTDYELIVVDDGSARKSDALVAQFDRVEIHYFYKPNEGPGPTRNYGANRANGEWLLFLDSDCFLPEDYLSILDDFLSNNKEIDAFGGPDRDHTSFTPIQKAISFSMTSWITTGGIRGSKQSLESFKPRSFNMGIRKQVFDAIGGFGGLRFGEDIDISLRILEGGYQTALIEGAFVYHRRRSTFRQFFKQIYNSGTARIVLNELHPGTLKVVHLLPFSFVLGHLVLVVIGFIYASFWLLLLAFPLLVVLLAFIQFKNLGVSLRAIVASYIQLGAYALGFLSGWWQLHVLKKKISHAYLSTFYD